MVDLTQRAFDLADIYRMPVMVLADGILGQMMEPVELKPIKADNLPEKKLGNERNRRRTQEKNNKFAVLTTGKARASKH
jgi:2-oxoglutarate ferredoxin oxidoreductase subunit alpha